MPSKEAKKRKYAKDYRAANKEKLCAYSKSYSKEHDRNEYFHEYYAYDRDLSQKRSATHSKSTYHKDPGKNRAESAARSKKSYHKDIEKSRAECAARFKSFYEKHIEASRLVQRERSLYVMYYIVLCIAYIVYLYLLCLCETLVEAM